MSRFLRNSNAHENDDQIQGAARRAKSAAPAKSSSTRSRAAVKPARRSARQPKARRSLPKSTGRQRHRSAAQPKHARTSSPAVTATKSAFAPIAAKEQPPRRAPVAPESPTKPTVETVSLIEPHTRKPKRAATGESVKRTILPPISRIREKTAGPRSRLVSAPAGRPLPLQLRRRNARKSKPRPRMDARSFTSSRRSSSRISQRSSA